MTEQETGSKPNTSVKIKTYIHRVCLEQQQNTVLYRLLCCNKQRVFTYLVDRSLMPEVNIVESSNKYMYFVSQQSLELVDFQKDFGLLSPEMQDELSHATLLLEETMEAAAHLQFIHKKNIRNNMRIAEPLSYPRSEPEDIPGHLVYEAVLLGSDLQFPQILIQFEKFSDLIKEIYENIAEVHNKYSIERLIKDFKSYKNNILHYYAHTDRTYGI